MPDEVAVNPSTAEILGLHSLDREGVANRLAEIGGLRRPAREETQEFLVEVLLKALRQIPSSRVTWSWGEFHNGGIQPLYDASRPGERWRWAVYAADLGLTDDQAQDTGEDATADLAQRVGQATEALLHELRVKLESAGVSPYGPGHPSGS
jgi:hypothetical protein